MTKCALMHRDVVALENVLAQMFVMHVNNSVFFLYDIGVCTDRLLSIIDYRNKSDMPCGRAYSSAWRTRHWTTRTLPAVALPNSNTGHGTAWQEVCRPPCRKPFRLLWTALKRTCRWVVVAHHQVGGGPCSNEMV